MSEGEIEEQEPFGLAEPQSSMLAGYKAALARGWSPDNTSDESSALLAEIDRDPTDFILRLSDKANQDARGRTFTLPDGSQAQRLPSIERWIWDGSFAGRIGLRYQPGTDLLPAYSLGHIGYAIVPWRRNRGYATRALGLILDHARRVGLRRVELTADAANEPSQNVIVANGGRFMEAFEAKNYGDSLKYRYEIALR